jgi:hypothetical protein
VLVGKHKIGARRRRKRAPTPELDKDITAVKARRKTAAADLATASKNAQVRMRPTLDALGSERRQDLKETHPPDSESVRKDHIGLDSFLSMRRIEASLRNASAL